jgi:hypothetical protein
MKIVIDTSSFSFSFIGIWLAIISVVVFLLLCKIAGLIILLIAILLIIQKYKYLIPKKSTRVSEQVEKILKSLSLSYQKIQGGFSTKTVQIKVVNYGLFTILRFKFEKVYTVQGKYLTEAVVKYQRYI